MEMSLPLYGPETSGEKLTPYVQDTLGARVTADAEVDNCGQVEALEIPKPAVMLGFVPLPGTAKAGERHIAGVDQSDALRTAPSW